MTSEREAMTLERELRAHVAGMQCAIDNCGLSPKEWDTSARYAMDNIGEWKRLLSDYAAHLSRAAEPVAWCAGLEATVAGWISVKAWSENEFTMPLYTEPPEPARDAKCKWIEDDIGIWDTACGNRFCVNDGTPSQNHMRHCCYCGHELEEVPYSEDAAMAQESGE